ncbi:hypothetical protein [Aquimarina sediminis]|uniref:hypothetical protein n=1 Tax=Aquimarina sediminis TaxID=2070536 RepID=UPI000CA03BF8|nr:hypothetical protein [Aquimarina sediminis]
MKHVKTIILITLVSCVNLGIAQDSKDYIEFNDRKNIVHGVYVGLHTGYGEIQDEDALIIGLKVAYVANQQFEIGLVTKGLYSDQNTPGVFSSNTADLAAVYSGFHLEPIFFSKAKVNLSFPVLIGGGATGYINTEWEDEEYESYQDEHWDAIFVLEPGINALYNISRYVQIEAGIKYRFSSKVNFPFANTITNINGFSAGFGLKLGVFNLGRNRYKKKLPNHE